LIKLPFQQGEALLHPIQSLIYPIEALIHPIQSLVYPTKSLIYTNELSIYLIEPQIYPAKSLIYANELSIYLIEPLVYPSKLSINLIKPQINIAKSLIYLLYAFFDDLQVNFYRLDALFLACGNTKQHSEIMIHIFKRIFRRSCCPLLSLLIDAFQRHNGNFPFECS